MECVISTKWAEMVPCMSYNLEQIDAMHESRRQHHFDDGVGKGKNRNNTCRTCVHFVVITLSKSGWKNTRCEMFGVSECASYKVYGGCSCDQYELSASYEKKCS